MTQSNRSMDANYDPSPGKRNPHKWGYTDTRFEFDGDTTVRLTGDRYPLAGYALPAFVPFVEEMLGISVRREDLQEENYDTEIPTANLSEEFITSLLKVMDSNQVSQDDRDRLIHSHGQLSVDEVYRILYRDALKRVVDLVVYPETDQDVQALIELAGQWDVVLIPYGGGTNVSGALTVPREERRTVVSVDMRQMDKILWIDEENGQAHVQAGISGKALEAALGAKGYTSGHDPDSVELSTLGGWIATNASGMKKNRYGNIEDIVIEATLITPAGIIETHQVTPRNAIGIQPRLLLFGNEGNFGIVTRAVIKIHPLPEVQAYGSLVFPTFERGVEFLYELRRSGGLPASIRLVNNNEFRFGRALRGEETLWASLQGRLQSFVLFQLKGYDPKKMVACTILMEGNAAEVKQQRRTIFPLARRFGGLSGGSSGGKRGYMLTFGIAYIRDFFSQFQILGETFETSVPWNRIHDVTRSVKEELGKQALEHGIRGRPYLAYRVTQTYHTGVCIYFTMGFSGVGLQDPDKVYHQVEQRLRQVILDNGGSLSHHHGVGKIRQKFLPQIQTEGSTAVLRQVKNAVDPKNIFAVRNGTFD
ncbi:MAG: oxidase [Trueperaceae bacterium]|nr:oxidase [Trueperaceae bacterium]